MDTAAQLMVGEETERVRERARECFRKREKIRSSAEFREVMKKGKAYSGKRIVLFCLETEAGQASAGFATTRRVPGSVERNLAKRLMREAYRRVKYGIEAKGLRVVFLARGDAQEMTFDSVRQEMVELLTTARLWHG